MKVEKAFGFVSPRLGIRFEPGTGPDNLKIYGPDGKLFQTHCVLTEMYNSAENRADAEHQRAEADRQRADRLTAQLRELGFEPD